MQKKIKIDVITPLELFWKFLLFIGWSALIIGLSNYFETNLSPLFTLIGIISLILGGLGHFYTDNFYILDIENRKILYCFNCLHIHRQTSYATFSDIIAIGVDGLEALDKIKWTYRIVCCLSDGKVFGLSDFEKDFESVVEKAEKMSEIVGAPLFEPREKTPVKSGKKSDGRWQLVHISDESEFEGVEQIELEEFDLIKHFFLGLTVLGFLFIVSRILYPDIGNALPWLVPISISSIVAGVFLIYNYSSSMVISLNSGLVKKRYTLMGKMLFKTIAQKSHIQAVVVDYDKSSILNELSGLGQYAHPVFFIDDHGRKIYISFDKKYEDAVKLAKKIADTWNVSLYSGNEKSVAILSKGPNQKVRVTYSDKQLSSIPNSLWLLLFIFISFVASIVLALLLS